MTSEEKPKISFSILDTLLAFANNSIGSNFFRNIYFNVNGQKTDLTENGNLSCAVFVSSVLYLLKLSKDVHITVDSTIKDLKESGWTETKDPKPGCVLVWATKDFGASGAHRHIGFYIDENKAVSNNPENGFPIEHKYDFFDGRPVELILINPNLI